MNLDFNDLVAALKQQRDAQATEAAMMAAVCEGLKRRVAELEERIASLEGTP